MAESLKELQIREILTIFQ